MSSSSDLETGITQHIIQNKKKSTKTKTKTKTKPTLVVAADHGKNEGEDPHWAYEPPEGTVLLDHTVDVGEFEWDKIKDDDDTEIWLIRAPESVRSNVLYPYLPQDIHGLVDQSETSSRTRDRPSLFITGSSRWGFHEKAYDV